MPFININTNNLSRQLRDGVTFVDNYAYVPGTAITGDWSQPLTFTSLNDFKNTCGDHGPEGSITFQIVSGLLSSGIPVIFRRIACTGQDTQSQKLGVTKAEVIITHRGEDDESDISDLKVLEKYGGTFGNDLTITVRNTSTAYWLDVYYKYSLLESKKIISIGKDDTPTEINQKLIDALESIQFDRIDVEVLNDDAETFTLNSVSGLALSGGTDFDETKVAAEIPKSFEFIYDKILYQPMFITSGGYTDEDMSSSAPIADAMKKITEVRQDCRALIDLPLGTPKEEQQSLAAQVSYQQLSNTQIIPSASMCAPWQYMQVGTEQLWMPPSYVYLTVVGNALGQGQEVYTPKAGIATGQVSNIIKSEFDIGSDLADQWQSDSEVNINPIMRLQSGTYVIAGNSTLLLPDSNGQDENAFSESSADLTIIQIRRFVYDLATKLQFQYNSTTAFETFSLNVSNFLDGMASKGAVTSYDIYNVSTNDDPRTLKIDLDVFLTPTIKAITINLNVSYGNIVVTTVGGEN